MGFKARRPKHCCSACHHAFHDKLECRQPDCECTGFVNDKGEAVSYTVPPKS